MNLSFLIKKLFFAGVCSLTLLISPNSFAESADRNPNTIECSDWTFNPNGLIPVGTHPLARDQNGNWVKRIEKMTSTFEFQTKTFIEDPATKKKVAIVVTYDPRYKPACEILIFWADELIWYN